MEVATLIWSRRQRPPKEERRRCLRWWGRRGRGRKFRWVSIGLIKRATWRGRRRRRSGGEGEGLATGEGTQWNKRKQGLVRQ
ncbi:hypothetical protein CRG98_049310 [Punica granatum]|uniref:Uncharacterized protein n=1 Tax=Punica granatum TaxID=22663 RepID=A0A2I0HF33_PUNGR|nr:hypothetical protein CRG98_049310 [Punica granatum]